ncbi:centromere-binding protein [Grosmannia clavigera kw1407]|uniref:Centromere-binding protein n=1 Tax=Grosmannia clavigera (strain kw1407 / UAMH 11150) TaxID=655863 RepID=F0XSU6_GROCL|nr:centromere-binding protein [Grosmannia clavigera kw1407]EFW99182.1 centromere-binding protein [Grosmannia clavigera kw1407]
MITASFPRLAAERRERRTRTMSVARVAVAKDNNDGHRREKHVLPLSSSPRLSAMAETAEQQPDLLTGSPPQKRKRGGESASPDTRRSKRGASTSSTTGLTQGIEPAATAFMEATGTGSADGLTAAEFSVIQGTGGVEHTDATSAALASSTAAAALGSMYPTLHVPQSTEETFASQQIDVGGDPQQQQHHHDHHDHHDPSAYGTDVTGVQSDGLSALEASTAGSNGMGPKRPISGIQYTPTDNIVERRRRETINEGINELAKIVPGCEKNKGSILQRAVVFITQLKENETQNIEKWTLEKLLTEQAIAELSASNDKLKAEVERLYRELETWKRVAQNAGLQPPEEKSEPPS